MPRRFAAGEIVFREGDESDTCYIVRSGRARAVRDHTPTAARSRWRTSDPATSSASSRCSTTSGARRPSTRSRTPRSRRFSAATCVGCCASSRRSRSKLLASLGRRLRETNERLARQSFQTVQSRVAAVLAQLVRGGARRRRGRERRADHLDPGGAGPAGRLLARVGKPLPGGARARRCHHPGARPSSSSTTRKHWSATSISERDGADEFSAGGVVVRGDEIVVIVPVKRGPTGDACARAAEGASRAATSAGGGGRARGARGGGGRAASWSTTLGDVAYTVRAQGPAASPSECRFFLFEYRDGRPRRPRPRDRGGAVDAAARSRRVR